MDWSNLLRLPTTLLLLLAGLVLLLALIQLLRVRQRYVSADRLRPACMPWAVPFAWL